MRILDRIDRMILDELQLNGRLSNQELADSVGLSPSPCLRRVRTLENAGIIAGYRAVVDAKKVGLGTIAFVRVSLNAHDAGTVARVESMLRETPEFVDVYLLAGDSDYQMTVYVESFDAYEELLRTSVRTIPGISSIHTTFAVAALKRNAPLPV